MDKVSAPQGAPFPHHGTAEWLTRAEVAEQLKVSTATVTRLAEAGELEEVFVSAKSPRITAASLARHLERNLRHRVVQGAAVSSACVALLLLAGLFTAYESADESLKRQAREYTAEQKAKTDPNSLVEADLLNLSGTTISSLMEAGALAHLSLGGRRHPRRSR